MAQKKKKTVDKVVNNETLFQYEIAGEEDMSLPFPNFGRGHGYIGRPEKKKKSLQNDRRLNLK